MDFNSYTHHIPLFETFIAFLVHFYSLNCSCLLCIFYFIGNYSWYYNRYKLGKNVDSNLYECNDFTM